MLLGFKRCKKVNFKVKSLLNQGNKGAFEPGFNNFKFKTGIVYEV